MLFDALSFVIVIMLMILMALIVKVSINSINLTKYFCEEKESLKRKYEYQRKLLQMKNDRIQLLDDMQKSIIRKFFIVIKELVSLQKFIFET